MITTSGNSIVSNIGVKFPKELGLLKSMMTEIKMKVYGIIENLLFTVPKSIWTVMETVSLTPMKRMFGTNLTTRHRF